PARTLAMPIAGCASSPNRFPFISLIWHHAWRRRACTICITSRPSMKRIGPAKRKLPHGKLRAAVRDIARLGFSTLADSEPAWSLRRGDFFARSYVAGAQKRTYTKPASTNRGRTKSALGHCAINLVYGYRFHPRATPTWFCLFFGAFRRFSPGCRFRCLLSFFSG